MKKENSKYKGGCQCGRIRFEINGILGKASICHCRMCQKAFGNFFAPLVSVREASVIWSKEPARFQSSNFVKRGFCECCGTPLTYEAPDGMAIAIGAFDNPKSIEPIIQFGAENRIKYLDNINTWSCVRTEEDIEDAPFLSAIISYQYQDEQ
jgi:hypothetical protein